MPFCEHVVQLENASEFIQHICSVISRGRLNIIENEYMRINLKDLFIGKLESINLNEVSRKFKK